MSRFRTILIISIGLLFGLVSCSLHFGSKKDNLIVYSPDGSIKVQFSFDSVHCPMLSVSKDNVPLMVISHIGLDVEGINMADSMQLIWVDRQRCDSIWHQPWGENKEVRENFHELRIGMKTDTIDMVLEIKVFNDGLGFRYYYSGSDGKYALMGENTQFQFLQDGTCWSIPANFESYEFLYREQPLSKTQDANTPMTVRLDNGYYLSLHEASLKMMPEMTLRQVSPLTFKSELAPDNTGSGSKMRWTGDFDLQTSWRTITIGQDAVDLINSSLLLNLNAPPSPALDLSHIRPMKYIGIWWGMHLGINSWTPDKRHGATTQSALRYVNFAAANNIDAVLIEGWNQGWEQWGGSQDFRFYESAPDMDIDSVIRYAHRKGVEIIIHHETGGNIVNYNYQIDSAFHWCKQRGIHAIKTGYAGAMPDQQLHHSEYGVSHYWDVMTFAAHEGLMLDVHEPIKPTGLRREFPNLMTGEGVRGMEWNAWSDGNPPSHDATIPFTRMLAGPVDYTPGIFDITYRSLKKYPHQKWNQQDASQCRVHSTLAHQVALWVVFYSPWVMAADLIENYQNHPMFQFFRDYNPDCDWSKALIGEPGAYMAIARRSGDIFYIGAITNEEPRDVNIPLDFLYQGRYKATCYQDGPKAHYESNPLDYRITQQEVVASDVLTLHLAAGGGVAVILKPIVE